MGPGALKAPTRSADPARVVGKTPVLEANAAVSCLGQRAYGLCDTQREIHGLGVGWCHGHFSAAPKGEAP